IAIDSAGRKWIGNWGSTGTGLSVLDDGGTPFNKADDQWQRFHQADSGLVYDAIQALTTDAAGRKCISTSGGVSVLNDNGTPNNPADDQWIGYSTADGVPALTVYTITADAAGRKWIGGHEYNLLVLDDNGTPFNKADDQRGTFTLADGLLGVVH